MKSRRRYRLVYLWILLPLIALGLSATVGCSGGSSNSSGASSFGENGVLLSAQSTDTGTFAFAVGPLRLHGTVAFEGPVAAYVQLFANGNAYRVVGTLANGTVLVADATLPEADRRAAMGLADAPSGVATRFQWLWVTPVSTLLAAYRDAHPTHLTGADHVVAVKRFLGIGEHAWINRPFVSHPASRFSPAAFLREAAGRDLYTFSRDLVAQIDAGDVHPFREARNPRGRSSAEPIHAQAAAGAAEAFFGKTLLKKAGAAALKAGGKGLLKWGLASLGIGGGTQRLLKQMEQQLTDIQDNLDLIETGLEQLANSQLQSNVKTNDIVPIQNFLNGLATNVNQNALSPQPSYLPFTPTGFLASTEGQGLLGLADASAVPGYATDLAANCLGFGGAGPAIPNVVTGLVEQTAKAFGSTADPSVFYYDCRSDATTLQIEGIGSFYAGWMAGAALMLGESQHRAFIGDAGQSPALGVNSAQAEINGSPTANAQGTGLGYDANGILALGQRIGQQVPLALLGGESPLPGVMALPTQVEDNAGVSGGTMWAATGVEIQTKGYTSPYTLGTVNDFTVDGLNKWYFPTEAEVKALCARAEAVAKAANPSMPANQQVAYGLFQMGLISESSYTQGLTEVYIYNTLVPYGEDATLDVYRTDDGKNITNGLHLVQGKQDEFYLQPQDGHLTILLLVRPLPGQPRGAGIPDPTPSLVPPTDGHEQQTGMGQAVLSTAANTPPAVAGSATYASVSQLTLGQVWVWDTDLNLAAGITPEEIVVGQDPGTNQVRAYAMWHAFQVPSPDAYLRLYYNAGQVKGSAFNNWWFDYPDPVSPYFLVYTEITESVEWLSSDTTSAEVANHSPDTLAVMGGTLTGVSTQPTQSGFYLLDPVVNGSSITAGRILNSAELTAGTLTGGTTTAGAPFSGNVAPTPAPSPSPDPSSSFHPIDFSEPGFLQGGNVTAGTVSGGTMFTLTSPDQTTTHELLAGPTLTGATVNGNLAMGASTVYVPIVGESGLVTFHPGGGSATITASLLKTPGATTPINTQASTATYLTASLTPQNAYTPPPTRIDTLAVTPNYVKTFIDPGTTQMVLHLSGFATGETCLDLSTDPATQWEVWLMTPQGSPVGFPVHETNGIVFQTNPGDTNILEFGSGVKYVGDLLVRASNGAREAVAIFNVDLNNAP